MQKRMYLFSLTMISLLLFSIIPARPVLAAGDMPVLGGLGGSVTFQSGTSGVVIAPGLTITDDDNEVISAATVFISAYKQAGDVLNLACDGFGVSYNSTSGVLTVSGSFTTSQYQACLRNAQFSNPTNPNNTTARTVTISLGDAVPFSDGTTYSSDTGHWYKYISSAISWAGANAAASGLTYFGRQGYLATMTSAAENAFATAKLNGATAWLGGSDSAVEGTWRWVAGPENGILISSGYSNWDVGEPNQYMGDEDYLQFLGGGTGRWNDLKGNAGQVSGYVVEYGGTESDSSAVISGTVTVNVSNSPLPTISSIIPNAGTDLGGQSVVITGTNFMGPGYTTNSITFAGLSGVSCTVDSATQITCQTPANAAAPGPDSTDVTVTTSGGSATKTNGYLYVPPSAFTSVSQDIGPTTGGTPVIVTGTNFMGTLNDISWITSLVTFGGTTAACTVTDATHLSCTSPAHVAGTVSIAATTPGGTTAPNTLFTYIFTLYLPLVLH